MLDTPDGRKEKWGDVADATTPGKLKRTRSGSKGKGSVNLTLRDQEKVRACTLCMRPNGAYICPP